MLPVGILVPGSLTTVYTVARPAFRAVVKQIRAASNDSVNRTVNVFVVAGGQQVQYSSKDEPIGPNQISVMSEELELGPGDSILAYCSSAGAIELLISGYELDGMGQKLIL